MKNFAGKTLFIIFFLCPIFLFSQSKQTKGQIKFLSVDFLSESEAIKRDAIKVFMDCQSCDMDYIREKITFVNFVRDRNLSEVHIHVTTQATGSGGREYSLQFIGQDKFSHLQDTLTYTSQSTDTSDKIRRGLVRILKLGLIPYVLKTPAADKISVNFLDIPLLPTEVEDKWNSWVFNLGINGSMNGEKTTRFINFKGDLSINRVTPASRTAFR